MDLRQLRYFRTVAELKSFSQAAASLRVAQPSLSRLVQKLEHDLGVELLWRTTKGVVLTPAGQALLNRTRSLDAELESMRAEVSTFANRPTGRLRIGVQVTLSRMIMPAVAKRFLKRHSEASLTIVDGDSHAMLDSLLENRLDVALIDEPSHCDASLSLKRLWREDMMVAAPMKDATHPMFASRRISLENLADLPLILNTQRHNSRRLIDAAFTRQRIIVRPVIEVDGPMMIYEMVRDGLGYAIMSTFGVHLAAAAGVVLGVEIEPPIRRTIAFVSRLEVQQDPKVQAFEEVLMMELPRVMATWPRSHFSSLLGDAAEAPR